MRRGDLFGRISGNPKKRRERLGVLRHGGRLPDAMEVLEIGIAQPVAFKADVKADGRQKPGQRLGQVKSGQDWDVLMLVLLDEGFEPFEIHEADRETVLEAVDESRDSRRSRRGPLSVARFKAIGRLVWSRANGLEDEGYWENRASG